MAGRLRLPLGGMKHRLLFASALILAALAAAGVRGTVRATRARAAEPPVAVCEIPSVQDPSPAREVEIPIVDEEEDETPPADRVVEGRAVDEKGRPFEDLPLVVRVGLRTYATATDRDGRFRLETCEGPVSILAYNRYAPRVVGTDYVFDFFGE